MKTSDAAKMMGQLVVVTKVLYREHAELKRYWIARDREPRTGWFTGVRWLQNGYIEPGCSYGGSSMFGYEPVEYAPPYMKETDPRTVCALVTFWPNENPKKVPLDNIRDWVDGDPEPFSTSGYGETDREAWIESNRKIMKAEAHNLKRDAKGRFVK